ncbi:ExeA family protein [Acinetobacter ursingii]|uniref:ExeA family protein n=1 Tax=Acinetobacter ursingii TaxID=108980 RepID=UPI0021CDBE9E|nr:AAA family ATPase [Acinetobacter ursingii]MCU4481246.1 AAA family ATPase [Acinetobacter ursingii]MCU4505575.1 AAA family ATPase [Acinetobacter ursingii]MCU4571059.1 AAA family ATPase [Acinetobacter ursingii]
MSPKIKTLKELIEQTGCSQIEFAKQIPLSGAGLNLLIHKAMYPKRMPDVQLRITNLLLEKGIERTSIDAAFALLKPTVTTQRNEAIEEEEIMLLAKQSLTQQAKKTFGLFSNPFTGEVQSHDELFTNEDINYVRQALYQTAKTGGFVAISGESGSGKTTLRLDLEDRIQREHLPIIMIEPYIIGTEDNDIKGKTLKSGHIAESIIETISRGQEKPLRSAEARFRQVHNLLKESSLAGNSHVILIEEAHSLPIPTLKHLKRFFELKSGFKNLVSIILIGQTELANKLSERNPHVREVVQRCENITLEPLTSTGLEQYLKHRIKSIDKKLSEIITEDGIYAIAERLTQANGNGKIERSLLYPLAVGNLITGAMNAAADIGAPVIDRSVIMGV